MDIPESDPIELTEQDVAVPSNGSGNVRQVNIEQEMREAYLDYAMSVIISRALPDARDGLKPVQRRILYAMHDMGIRPNTPHKKSARIVGEVLGKYHPHGDSAVYDAMARMAQDFSLRYMLVDGQGNFGSVDGDSPAAMRYTEARLAKVSETLLQDIDMDTIDWTENFDGSLKEPSVLPAVLPNLLVNGASGIAVGMATNAPPHNLGEIADAIVYTIDNWERLEEISLDELMQFVQGPDFPTGGVVLGLEGLRMAYATGRGHIQMRAMAQIEEARGRFQIIITEIPYQLNKTTLLERIAELAREGKLDEISDLRDESDRRGMRIVIELKRGTVPKKSLNRLFKFTPLQSTFAINMLALVNGEPRMLSLKKALYIYIEHRQEVITRRSRFEVGKQRDRAHILEGLQNRPAVPRRRHPHHPPLGQRRSGARGADEPVRAERAAGAGHPGPATAPPGRAGAGQDRGGIPTGHGTHRLPGGFAGQPREDPGPGPRGCDRAEGAVRRRAPDPHLDWKA